MDFDVFEKLSELETKIYVLEKELKEKDDLIESLTTRNAQLEKERSSTGCIADNDVIQKCDLSKIEDGKSIADVLKEASENAIKHSGYDFDERTGLYFHKSSGYFYDPDRHLFFEPKTRTYLRYNSETGKYDPQPADSCGRRFRELEALLTCTIPENVHNEGQHYVNSPKRSSPLDRHRNRRTSHHRPRRHRRRRYHRSGSSGSSSRSHSGRRRRRSPYCSHSGSDLSSGSPTNSSRNYRRRLESADRESYDCSPRKSRSDDEKQPNPSAAVAVAAAPVIYPPGIRLVVLSSEHTPLGTVFALSSDESSRGWGCIGRNPTFCPSVNFPDDPAVSTIHCEIVYEISAERFVILDREDSSGTFLNDRTLQKMVPVHLNHGDVLRIGSSRLLVHSHRGSDVCDQCDPVALRITCEQKPEEATEENSTDVLMDLSSRTSRDAERRATLEQLKEKYGIKLLNSNQWTDPSNTYNDRAARRRAIEKNLKSAGLLDNVPLNPKPKPCITRRRSLSPRRDDVSSLPLPPPPITKDNRGAQMLSKMGWNPGQGLGKDSTGIVDPISPVTRLNSRAGLGATDSQSRSSNYSRTYGFARERDY